MCQLFTDKAASASLEFALCLPFLLGLVIGAEEFGRAFWSHHTLVQGTRAAARYLARTPDPASALYQVRATNLALYGRFDNAGTPRIPADFGVGPPTLAYTLTDAGGTWSGVPTYVTATATFTFSSTLIGWLGLDANLPMTVAHSERLQTD